LGIPCRLIMKPLIWTGPGLFDPEITLLAMLSFHVCHPLPPRKRHIWAQRLPGYFFCYRINKSERLALRNSKNTLFTSVLGVSIAFSPMFPQKCCKKWFLPKHRDRRRVRDPWFSEQHEHVTESRSRSDSVFKGYFSDDVFTFLEVGFRGIPRKSLLGIFWPAGQEPRKSGFGKILDLAMQTFHVCHDLPPRKRHIWIQRLPVYFFCYRINKSERLALRNGKKQWKSLKSAHFGSFIPGPVHMASFISRMHGYCHPLPRDPPQDKCPDPRKNMVFEEIWLKMLWQMYGDVRNDVGSS
jgi:hypothetical protein